MKINPLRGIYQHCDILSEDVRLAQVQAELEQLSKYRRQKLNEYQKWSDLRAVAERYKKHEAEKETARLRGVVMANLAKAQLDNIMLENRVKQTLWKIREIYAKPPSKWQRLKFWLKKTLSFGRR